ncbi:hypothetical protein [Psychrobium sp. 1_MG-2023]|nr:hypothetical protein [Psychrobium sp. 1_MG-2023]MDP2559582.1 hypothetical protein [Psychrobium sp. 1_MG-2023]
MIDAISGKGTAEGRTVTVWSSLAIAGYRTKQHIKQDKSNY